MSEETTPTTDQEAVVREALREVIDPELGLNVIELGLIRRIDISAENAHVLMILTTPFCPYAPQLLEMVRSTTQKTLGVTTTIEMGTEMWDPSFMEDGVVANWGLF